MKKATAGNLVRDAIVGGLIENDKPGKAPQRIRVTFIIETLDDDG
ncbi:MAG: hypothetical protein WA005_01725 [Candidatus Binataceae bacterium]